MKSFNMQALRGDAQYDDHQFQGDMQDVGINIPDHLLYTPHMNDFVLNEVYKQTVQNLPGVVNPGTGVKYTPDEASKMASEHRSSAKKRLNGLDSQ